MVLELGEVRQEMEKGEVKVLEGIIEKYKDKKSYYILKYSNWEGQWSNVLRTRYALQSKKPRIPLMGTKLWLVDNIEGTITQVYDLPLDIHGTEPFLDTRNRSENVLGSAIKMGGAILNA